MRDNIPVTDTEYELKEGTSIVCKTDLKGRITYANPAFVEASDYPEAELLGKPHNLTHHPDMPTEIFTDLWATLSERLPWTGMVKNRRKNGDYYWSLTNMTPLQQKPPTIGYMSVSNKPTRQQIMEAERIYRLFREGHAGSLKIRHGMVERGGLSGILTSIRRVPINFRIMLTTGGAAALMVVIGLLGWWEITPQAQAAGVQSWMPILLAVAGASGGLLLVLFGYFISRTILIPIDHALEVAHAIAWGDLSLRFEMDASDETAQLMLALNQMKTNLVAVVSDTGSLVNSISTAAQEIAELSSRTDSQTSSLTEPASAMMVLADTVKQVGQIAATASTLQQQAVQLAQVVGVFKLGGA